MKTIAPFTPIQYIIGKAEFFGLDFVVNEDVFIPRPETEMVVQAAIDIFNEPRTTNHEPRILDLCTGSGNIAIALTKNIPDCKIIASDVSDEALGIAKLNAARNEALSRIEFVKSDLFENISGRFDMIVSNPPYIARYEFEDLQKEVLKEPRAALDGGDDGFDFYRRIARDAPRYLHCGGYLIMEIGFGQREEISRIIEETKLLKVSLARIDHNGIDRAIVARNLAHLPNQLTPLGCKLVRFG